MINNESDDIEVTQKDDEQVEDQTDDTAADTDTGSQDDATDTDETDWKSEALKLKAILGRQEKKKEKPVVTQAQTEPKGDNLSAKDIILLSNSGIKDSEDIDEVLDFAKYKKIPVGEALKSPTLKAILADKAEYRRSAEVANTSGTKRTSVKASDETILNNAANGKLPEDPAALAEARIRAKLPK